MCVICIFYIYYWYIYYVLLYYIFDFRYIIDILYNIHYAYKYIFMVILLWLPFDITFPRHGCTMPLQGLILIGDGLQYISTLQQLKMEWQKAGSPEAGLCVWNCVGYLYWLAFICGWRIQAWISIPKEVTRACHRITDLSQPGVFVSQITNGEPPYMIYIYVLFIHSVRGRIALLDMNVFYMYLLSGLIHIFLLVYDWNEIYVMRHWHSFQRSTKSQNKRTPKYKLKSMTMQYFRRRGAGAGK